MKKLFASVSLLVLFLTGYAFAAAQTTNTNCLNLTSDMGVGATDSTTGGDVTKLQNFLIGRSFMRVNAGTALGTYGRQTASGVSQFQRAYGIIATGYVGPITRSNIQAITCAIGAVDTSSLPTTTISTSSVSLLTFTSPVAGALVVKGEKDITPDWTVSPAVVTTFGSLGSIKIELIDSTGSVVGVVGNNTKVSSRNNNKVENNFVRTLASKGHGRNDNVIDPGQYRLRATLVYTGTDTALAAQAATYASESGWFTVVNPAPKPDIKLSASTTTLTVSGPVTLTWTADASSTGCMFTDVVASTSVSVSSSGAKVVTPTKATNTYRVSCNLTSAWPLPGMTYTTSAQKGVTITIGASQVCNSEQTSTATGCVNLTKAFTCSNGTVVQIPAALVVNDTSRPQIEAQYCTSTTGTPTVTRISPQAGGSATIVTLTGTNLANTTGVAFFATNGSHVGTAVPISKTNTTVTFKVLGSSVPEPTTSTMYKVGVITSSCPEGCNSARLDYILVRTSYYNFSSGSGDAGKTACESSIQSTLGITRTCTQGGACGVNGQPSSSSNPSSAPAPAYGACIDPASIGGSGNTSAPVITLSNIGNPTVASGGTTTLSWSVTPTSGVTCTAASGSTVVGGNNIVALSNAHWDTPALYTTTTFGLMCTNAAGQSTVKTITVNVSQTSTGAGPTITLTNIGRSTLPSGGSTTLTWSVTPTDGTTCAAAAGATVLGDNGSIPLSSPTGGWSTPALYTTTTYGMQCTNANGVTTKTIKVNVNPPAGTLLEPTFSATCSQETRTNTYKITLRWNRVSGATNYPVRIMGPSFATNAVQYNGQSVVGFNNPSVVDNPLTPTGTSYTFEGLTATGTYTFWGHAWAPSSSDPAGTWSSNTNRTVTCSARRASADDGSSLAVSGSPAVLGAEAMCVDLPYNMHRGTESQSVSNLQSFLASRGYLDEVSGFYGDKTVSAVKAYQSAKGLPSTGMVYDFTRAAITSDSCE